MEEREGQGKGNRGGEVCWTFTQLAINHKE
jgi:hypothetical protein